MGILAHAVDARKTARTPAHTLPTQRPTPNTHTHPTKRMTRHFTTKSFLLVAALLVVAVSAAEAASGSRALLQVINIPLVGTVDFQNVAPFYGQIFSPHPLGCAALRHRLDRGGRHHAGPAVRPQQLRRAHPLRRMMKKQRERVEAWRTHART